MALLGIAVGLLSAAATPIAGQNDGYTAMYMSTDTIDRNVTKDRASVTIPFTVENHEGGRANYHYAVTVLFKDTIFHSGKDAWSEDMNVDEAHNIVNGTFALENGKKQTVVADVPIQSTQKWRYANVTIDLYRDGTPGVYRSLRLWAINQSTK